MDRNQAKDPATQETVERQDRKHEGARHDRPERPTPAEGDAKDSFRHEREGRPGAKRDEDKDKLVKPDHEKDKKVEGKGTDREAPQPAGGASDVVKTEPVDDEAASQGI